MNEKEIQLGGRDEHRDGDGVECAVEVVAASSWGGTCTLYRWYPPLLVVSTVMAGVFCLLYVTKPVFLEAPNFRRPEQFNVPVNAGQIAKSDEGVDRDLGGTIIPVHLDPGFSSLPGDSGVDEGLIQGVPPIAELEPLNVPRASKPLFEPLRPDEMSSSGAPEPIARTASAMCG